MTVQSIRRSSALFLLLIVAGCAGLGERPPENLSLTGVWRLDESRSESSAVLFDGLRESRGRAAGMRGGGGGGMRPPGGGMRGGMRGEGGGARQAGRGGMSGQRGATGRGGPAARTDMRAVLMANELDIEQREGETRIEYDGRLHRVYVWGEDAGGAESGWDRERFVLRMKRGPAELERTMSISDTGTELTIMTTLAKTTITQVYRLDVRETRRVYGERR